MKFGKILVPLDGSTLAEAALRTGLLHLWYGPPAAGSVEVARAEKVDLIVMAPHGRGGLERLVLRSVAESVHGTPVPVLIVRPEGAPVDNLGGAVPAGVDFRV